MGSIFPKNILAKHKIRPSKRLGQNFLIDKSALKKIITAAELKSTDIVLEIGPGSGVLTKELVKKVKKVIAVEKDKKMVEILKKELKEYENIEIINADILSFELQASDFKIVANLPYYITSPVIRGFLEAKKPPSLMVLMVQKEVAQRICAKPPQMNLLAVSVQFYGKPEIISYVSKNSFWPAPKVDSAIVKTILFKTSGDRASVELFFKVVKAGFSHPRKQLGNNFSNVLKLDKEKMKTWLLQNKINPNQRAESLTINDWIILAKTYSALFTSNCGKIKKHAPKD